MSDVANYNTGLVNLGQYGLDQLNESVIEWESRVQYVSLRQQKYFDQICY